MHIVRVVNVANARYDVSVFLVDLKHLLCCPLCHITEKRNLERYRVDFSEMVFDLRYATRQDHFFVSVDALCQDGGVVTETNPGVPIVVKAKFVAKTLGLKHSFLAEYNSADSCTVHLVNLFLCFQLLVMLQRY